MTEREFQERVVPLQSLMYALSLKLKIPPDDSADIIQETLIKLWRYRDSIPADATGLKAYCLKTFRNECISAVRKSKPTAWLDEAPEIGCADGESAEYHDTRERIENIVDSLPQGQREVLRLSGFGGFDNKEIARATGMTENNVRQLLSRGRRRLRELFAND